MDLGSLLRIASFAIIILVAFFGVNAISHLSYLDSQLRNKNKAVTWPLDFSFWSYQIAGIAVVGVILLICIYPEIDKVMQVDQALSLVLVCFYFFSGIAGFWVASSAFSAIYLHVELAREAARKLEELEKAAKAYASTTFTVDPKPEL